MRFFKGKGIFHPEDLDSVIAACRQNNTQAQRALVKLFYGYVKSISLRYSSDDQVAEEILNDSFLKAFNNLHKYDENQPFKAWLRTIAVNTAIDYYRKSIKQPVYQDYDQVQVADISEDIISHMAAEEILAMVRQLTPAYRMVFTLYVIDGYSHREIAEILGIREGTSKSNLQDARRKLQSMIFKANPNLYAAYELKTLRTNED
ncbi:MAG: RNA polymerase sigma factor [Lentimicrobium sp.]|jgi:RNA polymerase sigma-70 factor, ECF subfamily|nr:RNA polymerase sigma factor [Lentimicrobium sp.]